MSWRHRITHGLAGTFTAGVIVAVGGPTPTALGAGTLVVAAALVTSAPVAFAVAMVAALVVTTHPVAAGFVALAGATLLVVDLGGDPWPVWSMVVGVAAAAILVAPPLVAESLLHGNGTLLLVAALLLYGIHRYERVRLGLVTES